MITTAIIISAATIGFRCITAKGMIFYFLRGWLDEKAEYKKEVQKEIQEINGILKDDSEIPLTSSQVNALTTAFISLNDINFKRTDALLYAFKPIILCSTCMASIHSIIWFPIITGGFDWSLILIMLIVAFLNTLFFGLVELIQAATNKLNAIK